MVGRKHLKTIMREVEGAANTCLNDLEVFVNRLVPLEPASSGLITWERNFKSFEAELQQVHKIKRDELAKYTQWADRLNKLVNDIIQQVIEAIRQVIRFARFSTMLVLMSNYYLWKRSVSILTGFAQGMLVPVRD